MCVLHTKIFNIFLNIFADFVILTLLGFSFNGSKNIFQEPFNGFLACNGFY